MVNNGIREFSTYVSPRQELCDGNWHKITGRDLKLKMFFFTVRTSNNL